ncbi:hypothetical protein ACOSQ2_015407 [Xanthoceras sorbifolium]
MIKIRLSSTRKHRKEEGETRFGAIPTYAISCFKLPSSVDGEIQSLCSDFWWGINANKKKVHWLAWSKMCQPKELGGIVKLGWRPSFIWRSLLWGREILGEGIRWKVGNGENISIYDDCWLPKPYFSKILSPKYLPKGVSVSELISNGWWNEDIVRRYFIAEEAKLILSILLPVYLLCDSPL